jgi:hypothetical protein
MIANVPTAEDYIATGLGLLNPSWSRVDSLYAALLNSYEGDLHFLEERRDFPEGYFFWQAAEQKIANAFIVAHQGVEFLLKGRIAAVSPYLLIVVDQWPAPDDNNVVEFSNFKTIDASQLPRAYNAVCTEKLSDDFRTYYEEIRRLRNRVMHSTGELHIQGPDIYKIVLKSYKFLMPGESWFKQREKHLCCDEQSSLDCAVSAWPRLVAEALRAINCLAPADSIELLGFDKKKRRYLCPFCDGQLQTVPMRLDRNEWCMANLAQFPGDGPGQTLLKCYLCSREIHAKRARCLQEDCKGDVISVEGQQCLSCGKTQGNT